jgi:hypothetical protein
MRYPTLLLSLALVGGLAGTSAPIAAQRPVSAPALTYADLADLADTANVVARVRIRDIVRLPGGQARAGRPGWARVYVVARTRALLVGQGLGESVRYLADVPLTARGSLGRLPKGDVLIFARTVPGRPGELQLTAPDAQVPWSPDVEARTRALLRELVAPGAAPRVRSVREAMYVPGNLLGEGETQIFLDTFTGEPISVSVVRRPGAPLAWGVSLSEIVDQSARPPARETLTWYRLACTLPDLPPRQALAGDPNNQRQAAEDYRFVRSQLGACPRNRPPLSGALAPRAGVP